MLLWRCRQRGEFATCTRLSGQTSLIALISLISFIRTHTATPQSNFCPGALFDLLLLNNNFPSGGNGLSAWHNLSSRSGRRPLFQPRLGVPWVVSCLLAARIIPQERCRFCNPREKRTAACGGGRRKTWGISHRTLHKFYPVFSLSTTLTCEGKLDTHFDEMKSSKTIKNAHATK